MQGVDLVFLAHLAVWAWHALPGCPSADIGWSTTTVARVCNSKGGSQQPERWVTSGSFGCGKPLQTRNRSVNGSVSKGNRSGPGQTVADVDWNDICLRGSGRLFFTGTPIFGCAAPQQKGSFSRLETISSDRLSESDKATPYPILVTTD